jgi:hypothetical protein
MGKVEATRGLLEMADVEYIVWQSPGVETANTYDNDNNLHCVIHLKG